MVRASFQLTQAMAFDHPSNRYAFVRVGRVRATPGNDRKPDVRSEGNEIASSRCTILKRLIRTLPDAGAQDHFLPCMRRI
jgi:hypothetical protein